MYFVIFNDEVHGMNVENFDNFDDAMEYWNAYADTPTCLNGTLFDATTSEVIWQF